MQHSFSLPRGLRLVLITLMVVTCLQSCYSYRISTKALSGSEVRKATAHSFLWGLAQSPKDGIKTPVCDSLGVNGMSDVKVKTNFGYALITILTVGIWTPMKIEYKCGKPCQVVGGM